MNPLSRRQFIAASLLSFASRSARGGIGFDGPSADVHQQLLDLAARRRQRRRARFAAVKTKADLDRSSEVAAAGASSACSTGLPERKGAPPARITGTIEADDYLVEKLVYESFPGYFVSALLYRPKKIDSPLPGVLSPCGHSTTGKAERDLPDPAHQPGQARLRRADLRPGRPGGAEPVLGRREGPVAVQPELRRARRPGQSALPARHAAWLATASGTACAAWITWPRGPRWTPSRIGCVGNSGGGTLTAYIAALDPRVAAAAICCYITTLPRRMGNRIQDDPAADPEQDIFGFVSEGIDHAGLLALLRRGRRCRHGTVRFLPHRGGPGIVRGSQAALRGRRRRRPDRARRGRRAARADAAAAQGRLCLVRSLAGRPQRCRGRSRRSR